MEGSAVYETGAIEKAIALWQSLEREPDLDPVLSYEAVAAKMQLSVQAATSIAKLRQYQRRMRVGSVSGFLAEDLGYAGYYWLTAALALPGLALLPLIRARLAGNHETPAHAASAS